MKLAKYLPVLLVFGLVILLMLPLIGCNNGGDGDDEPGNLPADGTGDGSADGDEGGDGGGEVPVVEYHTDLVLRDRNGDPITAGSAEPYSPRRTCGACHDIDEIANGYHFQQGRTDADGNIVMKEDYFADGRSFIQSAGMYGKW